MTEACAFQIANFHIFDCCFPVNAARILYLESTRMMQPFLRRMAIPASAPATNSARFFFGA
jgi:hypothetical protein